EDEDIGFGQDQFAKRQPCLFAAGKRFGRLGTFLAGKEHLAKNAANVFDVRGGIPLMQPVSDGQAMLNGCAHVLRKVAHLRLVTPEDGPRIECEAGLGEAGIVSQKALEHGGFSGAVAAHEADSFAAEKVGRKSIDHLQIAVKLRQMLQLKNVLAAGTDLVKFDVGALDVGASQLVGLQALNLFAPACDLRRSRSGGETRDELVKLG